MCSQALYVTELAFRGRDDVRRFGKRIEQGRVVADFGRVWIGPAYLGDQVWEVARSRMAPGGFSKHLMQRRVGRDAQRWVERQGPKTHGPHRQGNKTPEGLAD